MNSWVIRRLPIPAASLYVSFIGFPSVLDTLLRDFTQTFPLAEAQKVSPPGSPNTLFHISFPEMGSPPTLDQIKSHAFTLIRNLKFICIVDDASNASMFYLFASKSVVLAGL